MIVHQEVGMGVDVTADPSMNTADDGDVVSAGASVSKADAAVAIVNGDGDAVDGKTEAERTVAETNDNTTVGNQNQNNDAMDEEEDEDDGGSWLW